MNDTPSPDPARASDPDPAGSPAGENPPVGARRRLHPGLTPASEAGLARARRFEGHTAWPLFVASVVFFGATVALVSGSIHDPDLVRAVRLIAFVTYGLILLDFLIRLVLARAGAHVYLRRNWFELVSLVLPFLRPFVIIIYLWRLPAFRKSNTTIRVRLLVTTFLFMFMFVYLVSSAVWLVERRAPDANIVNLDDAIWWGFTTLSTVGYGDFVPVTAIGRVLAVGLMLGGIAIVGTTTALVVSVLGEQIGLRRESHLGAALQVDVSGPDAATSRVDSDEGRSPETARAT